MGSIIKCLKQAYEKYFKSHCSECGGVMDAIFLDMQSDRLVYRCRDCGKEWI